jgi:hypothetical protein
MGSTTDLPGEGCRGAARLHRVRRMALESQERLLAKLPRLLQEYAVDLSSEGSDEYAFLSPVRRTCSMR